MYQQAQQPLAHLLACDNTAKTAKFEYDYSVGSGTSFIGGIYVELYNCEGGDPNGSGYTLEITT